MKRHFTATVYVLGEGKVLLILHKKLNKWLPPGGHLDPNETPSDAAKREVLEETGYKVELISQENIWYNSWNAASFPRPYLCLLEEIPAFGNEPAHQHMDMVYVGRVVGGEPLPSLGEIDALKWFSMEDLHQLKPDEEIFLDTLEVALHLLSSRQEATEPLAFYTN